MIRLPREIRGKTKGVGIFLSRVGPSRSTGESKQEGEHMPSRRKSTTMQAPCSSPAEPSVFSLAKELPMNGILSRHGLLRFLAGLLALPATRRLSQANADPTKQVDSTRFISHYDNSGRLRSLVDPMSQVTTYTWDAAVGRLVSRTEPSGRVIWLA